MLKKRVEDSLTEQTYLVMHKHINGYGRLFGGQLMAWIDEVKASMLIQGSEGMKHARQQKRRHKSFTVQTHGSQPQPHCRPITTYFSTTDPWGAVGGRSRRKKSMKSLPTS